MLKYILQRIGAMLLTLFLVMVLSFMIIRLMPMSIFENNAEIRKAMNQWIDGTLFPNEPMAMQDLYHTLLVGDYGNLADNYFVLKDFGSYSMANLRIMEDYQDRDKWLKMSIMNTAKSGFFSSDRTIREYNEKVWRIQKLEG